MPRNAKQWPCFLCDRLYAELEEAETCEREHDDPAYEREKHEDDGRLYSDPGDFKRGYED